ncbi:hypothetical protein [Amycolatopsis ultiminotia]|uniref:hypothetical protein n=1 Tax=Amycolatopsis ultiminotia TaxID=543629 RepID=UPI003CD0C21C
MPVRTFRRPQPPPSRRAATGHLPDSFRQNARPDSRRRTAARKKTSFLTRPCRNGQHQADLHGCPSLNRPTPDARRPTPDARRPTPDARRPTPDARRPTPNAQRPTPNAQRPTPNAQRPTHESRTAPLALCKPVLRTVARPRSPGQRIPSRWIRRPKPSRQRTDLRGGDSHLRGREAHTTAT